MPGNLEAEDPGQRRQTTAKCRKATSVQGGEWAGFVLQASKCEGFVADPLWHAHSPVLEGRGNSNTAARYRPAAVGTVIPLDAVSELDPRLYHS